MFSDEKLNQMANYLSYVVVGLLVAFLLLIVAGQRYTGVLSFIGTGGLHNEEGGVYTDCTKPENRHIAFCEPPETVRERTWQDLKGKSKPLAFSLNE